MNTRKNIKDLFDTTNSIPDYVFLFSALVLILPFFILSYYSNPSVDDYNFVFNTRTLGFWGAQWTSYTDWMGRYFSTFILSASPVIMGIYKLIPILLLLLTIHVLYRFVRFIIPSIKIIHALVTATVVSFCFLNGMPTLAQGIYWLSSSFTYSLSNILILHLVINCSVLIANNSNASSNKKYINCFLIFALSGSNETSMLLTDVFLLLILAYDTFIQKKLRKEFLFYMLLAIICSLIVFLAPGNEKRALDFTSANKHQLLFTIFSCSEATFEFISKWLIQPQLLLLSLLIFVYCYTNSSETALSKKKGIVSLLVLLTGLLLICCSFFVGFWSIGFAPPYRTINITYWIFICAWTWFLTVFFGYIIPLLKRLPVHTLKSILLICIFICFYFMDLNGNYTIAVNDIISGKAYIYNKEWFERHKTMKECKDNVCSIPSFSAFPSSIFNKDISAVEKTYWNDIYAHYYNKVGIKPIYKEPLYADRHFFNLDNEQNQQLEGLQTITTEFSFSTPNSSCINEQNPYSVCFSMSIKDIKIVPKGIITHTSVNVRLYSPDSVINVKVVVCVSDPKKEENLSWHGKDINIRMTEKNEWFFASDFIPIDPEHALPENKIFVYVWNVGKSRVFVDNMEVVFY